MWDAFHLALEREGADREDFLLAEFGDQPDQLAEIKALLSAHDDASGDGADSRAQIIEDLQRLDPENLVGETIGDYRIHELIGEGGMGLVYAAEQLQPIKRRVALKIIKLGMDTREVIARFESERQALALMEHPNVARILDAGATSDGRPYFVNGLCAGCRDHKIRGSSEVKSYRAPAFVPGSLRRNSTRAPEGDYSSRSETIEHSGQ